MLVTVSGMVGSGKSTAARHLVQLLQDEGFSVESWRFQSLPCFGFLRSRRRTQRMSVEPDEASGQRWRGYVPRRLTARVTFGYILRILAFRVYWWKHSRSHQVCSRYFYDSFVHYELNTRIERVYAALVHRLIPHPDVAVLLVASPETIAKRRPHYSNAYLTQVWKAYETLPSRFSGLVRVSTDPGQPSFERLEDALRQRMKSGGGPHRST